MKIDPFEGRLIRLHFDDHSEPEFEIRWPTSYPVPAPGTHTRISGYPRRFRIISSDGEDWHVVTEVISGGQA